MENSCAIPVSTNSKGGKDFNDKHDTGIKMSSNDNDLGNKFELNLDINQNGVLASSLTAPFHKILLSK